MLARANFDQTSDAAFAMSHPGLFRALGRLPHGPLHKALIGAAWLETWVRWPLKTLNILDGVDRTFDVLDPEGQRFGLTAPVRKEFRRNLLYNQIADLVVLMTSLERRDFRRRALVVENEEALRREQGRGPGAIVAGFRLGAYPVLPWALAGLGSKVSMIVGDESLAGMGRGLGKRFMPRLTERVRFHSSQDRLVLARCLEGLREGGLACTLAELSPFKFQKTVEIEFFDWKIQVPYGIAYLSAATGRSIVPAALTREAGPRFRLSFGEPLPPPARDRASVRESTQRLYGALEEQILRFPEQWIGWTLLSSHMGIELQGETAETAPTLS